MENIKALKQAFVCRINVQSIFKNVRRNKSYIVNVNLKKYPKQIKHPVIDLNSTLMQI